MSSAMPEGDARARRRSIARLLLFVATCGPWMHPAPAQPADTAPSDPKVMAWRAERTRFEQRALKACRRGAEYLAAVQQPEGGWVGEWGPGISALCTRALAQAPGFGPDHAAVDRGVQFVLRSQRDDGGICSAEGHWKNYETSVAVSMLAALGDRQRAAIDRAVQFLKDNQWDESESVSSDDPRYGGAGYGRGKRPDLSNTQLMLDALRDSGLAKDDPAYKKALVFIQRCQMRGESNDQPFAQGSPQGGFIYSPLNGGESKAGRADVGGRRELQCYGSMTYAGLKSMIYAGLSRDDPRVRAALDWIRSHWTLDHNPGMPGRSQEGLFYYFHTFSRAMDANGDLVVNDAAGRQHFWREELVERLEKLQRDDGRWVNQADRWMEGRPELTTAYAMLALEAAYPQRASGNK